MPATRNKERIDPIKSAWLGSEGTIEDEAGSIWTLGVDVAEENGVAVREKVEVASVVGVGTMASGVIDAIGVTSSNTVVIT